MLRRIADERLTDKNLSAISVIRLTEGAKIHLADGIPAIKLYITADSLQAKSVYTKLNAYEKNSAVYLPHRDDVLVHRGGFSLNSVLERANALSKFVFSECKTIVVSADAMMQKLPKPELVAKYSVKLKKEDIISPQSVADKLALCGYIRQDMIADVGDFALRGDILDIYSIDGSAYRVNFFDELIEDIKIIDVESMLPIGEIESVVAPPASDIILDKETADKAVAKLKKHSDNAAATITAELLHEGVCSPSAIWALPFIEDATATVFDYMDYAEKTTAKKSVVVIDEPKVVAEKIAILGKEFSGRLKPLAEAGEILDEHRRSIVEEAEIRRRLLTARKLSFSVLALSNPLFEPKLLIEPKCRPVTRYYLDVNSTAKEITNFILNGFKVLFACGSFERAKGVLETLTREGVYAEYSEDGEGSSSVQVTPLGIINGFNYPDLKVVVVGVAECVGKHRGESVISQKTQFIAPKAGDYVVHRFHGVGICEGTQILKSGDYEKEYVVLRYRDGDKLYVASDQMDNLQKFVGEENPKLNKLGGKEFEREKAKVRASVKKLAVNLVELYAKREKQKGFRYSSDTVWQKEFEDKFEFEETPDQLKAIDDIKRDMESGKIMDRLLVGDVGFGKTEVAFRAMFKTIIDAKQAVLLAPTTILARQHYELLKPRLDEFGIDCALLTRLQSEGENNETLNRLKDGTLHVVVATHKVLSENVRFHDLGLLVLDEEQRFGVDHKEKLKSKYPLVNVLTLSATPIPRTLNMSLSGIRDISMLETAPKGRLPVQTYVLPYSDSLAVDAITRECSRGGQTLILLNDIEALDFYANRLSSMLDEKIRIITAHGQMAGGELERRIGDFYEKRYDVLIATTIIENGIDLPDANTLIVIDSGRFGLAQLYQLRGRVGRRGALAHAYFTVPENGALSEIAGKRLQALLDNTEIGSGFKVALSDLSIRGAGNLLGAEQHGHIERVGYEMYIEILNEAVEELRTGRATREVREVEMKVDAPAFIREGYVSGRDKMRIYKRIATVSSFSARDELLGELNEVFGAVEPPLRNLIDISLLKNFAKKCEVMKIVINRNGAGATFYDSEIFKNEGIMRAVSAHSDSVVLTSTIPPSLIFDVKKLPPEKKIGALLEFFGSIQAEI